jgi:hypothetical protein
MLKGKRIFSRFVLVELLPAFAWIAIARWPEALFILARR